MSDTRPLAERGGEMERSLAAFAALTYERGPTVRELQAAIGLTHVSIAAYRIAAMARLGWIEPVPSAYEYNDRGYRLTPRGRELAAGMAEHAGKAGI